MCFSAEDAKAIAALVERISGLPAAVEALEEGEWLVRVKGKMDPAVAKSVLDAVEDLDVETVAYHGHTGGDDPTPYF